MSIHRAQACLVALAAAAALAGCGVVNKLVDHHKSVALALCVFHADRAIHDLKAHHEVALLYHAYEVLKDCKHV